MRNYQYTIQLLDQFTGPLARIQQQYGSTISRMDGFTRRFQSSVGRVGQLLDKLKSKVSFNREGQSISSLSKRLDELAKKRDLAVGTSEIRRANREIDALQTRINRMQQTGHAGNGAGGGSSGMGKVGRFVLGAGLLAGIGSFAKSGMDREQIGLQLQQFLKTPEATNAMLGRLNQFADKTPFTNDEVYGAGKSMLAARVAPGTVLGKLHNVGELAAGSGKNFGDLSQAYAKIKMKGFIDGGELHQEFGGTLLMEQLKKNMGVNGDQLFKMAEKHQIRYGDVDKAITGMTTGKGDYAGSLDKLAGSAGGKLSTFMGTMGNKIAEWAASQNSTFGKIFDFGTSFLSKMGPIEEAGAKLFHAFAPLGDALKTIFNQFGLVGQNGSAMDGIIRVLAGTINAAASIVTAFSGPLGRLFTIGASLFYLFGKLQMGFTALKVIMATNPATAWLVGIGALVVGIQWAWDNIDGFRNSVLRAWESIKSMMSSVGPLLKALIAPDKANIMAAIDAVKKGWASGLANGEAAVKIDRAERLAKIVVKQNGKAGTGSALAGGMQSVKDGNANIGKAAGLNASTQGAKSTSITINLKSLIEGGVHMHSANVRESVEELRDLVTDQLIRVLSSANAAVE